MRLQHGADRRGGRSLTAGPPRAAEPKEETDARTAVDAGCSGRLEEDQRCTEESTVMAAGGVYGRCSTFHFCTMDQEVQICNNQDWKLLSITDGVHKIQMIHFLPHTYTRTINWVARYGQTLQATNHLPAAFHTLEILQFNQAKTLS